MFQEERTREQRHSGIKTWCKPSHTDILHPVLLGGTGQKDWSGGYPVIKGLECQLRSLGFTSRQRGANEGVREMAGHPLWFPEIDLAGGGLGAGIG